MTIETSKRLPPTQYAPPRVPWEDYLPWALANEFRSEWVDGEIIEVMPTNRRHQRLIRLILFLVTHHAERQRLGEVFFDYLMKLQHRPSGRVPDVMFVTNEHLDRD